MRRASALAALAVLLTIQASAQINDSNLVWKPVKWAIPKPEMTTLELNGKKVYKVGKNIFGMPAEHNGMGIMAILYAPELVAAAELVHVQDPKGMPDVDKFLAALAVKTAVETPEGFTNGYIGSGKLDGRELYLFETASGANVGAQVSDDRKLVVVMPAPSEK